MPETETLSREQSEWADEFLGLLGGGGADGNPTPSAHTSDGVKADDEEPSEQVTDAFGKGYEPYKLKALPAQLTKAAATGQLSAKDWRDAAAGQTPTAKEKETFLSKSFFVFASPKEDIDEQMDL